MFPSSPANDYFRAIETTFIVLRGAPLLLAPDDWQVAREWHRQGIPLRLVEQTLEEVFAKLKAKEGEDGRRKLVTLRYCRRAVERAWRRRRELLAPAQSGSETPALDPAPRLAALAAALPEDLANRRSRQDEILSLAGDPEEIERQLTEVDAEFVAVVLASLEPDAREELDNRVQEAVQPLASRLTRADLERARGVLEQQIVRRLMKLPVLSLFSPEAESGS